MAWDGEGIDTSVSNVARMYDYMLGGKDNFAADREAADKIIGNIPRVAETARQNREFLRRAVRFLAREAGIRQFIDIGAGLPTRSNTHQVARECRPDARVAYVDHDPLVITHARALLATGPHVTATVGDLLDPAGIIGNHELRNLVDFREPIAVLLLAVLHFIPDHADPWGIVGQLMDPLLPGSYLAISHGASDHLDAASRTLASEVYAPTESGGATPRSRADITRFFSGLKLAAPGLVDIAAWRPPAQATGSIARRTLFYGGVGRKP